MIEGIWKNYEFKIASSKDFHKISEFLSKYYYQDEPITTMLGWTEKKARDVDDIVKQFLEHNLSLYAEDINSKEIAAVRIGYDGRKNINLTQTFQSQDNLKVQVLKDQLLQIAETVLQAKYPEKDYAVGFLSSVANSHRGQGLASEIYSRSVKQFRKNGFSVTRNYFSSKITMKIVKKLGYEELSRIYLGKLRDMNGLLVFPEADDDFYATFMVKRLDTPSILFDSD